MLQCEYCNMGFSSNRGKIAHIQQSHKVSAKQWYDTHKKKPGDGICPVCGSDTTFKNSTKGYLTYCSNKCATSVVNKGKNLGRVQSADTIKRRLDSTDQVKKERNRKRTMMNRYGVDNPSQVDEIAQRISTALTGKTRPRTKSHQKKIVESKRRNGTNVHSLESKRRISETLLDMHSRGAIDKSKFLSKKNTYVHGHHNGHYYRSSYELEFLRRCEAESIEVVSAENNEFGVTYVGSDNREHTYFPDYYLPQFEIVVEVKPESMLEVGDNPAKFEAARVKFKNRYHIITENCIFGQRLIQDSLQ